MKKTWEAEDSVKGVFAVVYSADVYMETFNSEENGMSALFYPCNGDARTLECQNWEQLHLQKHQPCQHFS